MAKLHEHPETKGAGLELSPVSRVGSEAVRALTGLQKTLLAGILASGVSSAAAAEESNTHLAEFQVAQASDWVEWTVARAFEWLATTPEELNAQIERQQVISDVSRLRQNGVEYYGPYLEEFSSLSEQDQYEIALLVHWENAQWGPDYSQETIDLVRNLRLPESLIQAILDEAVANGTDEFFEIPGFEETLQELREQWKTQNWDTFARLVEKSPENVAKIYFVYAVNTANANLAQANEELEDVQRRLVDAQWRLVDANWQLLLAQELEDKANEVWESADALRSN